jgi:putative hydrolase of the HAD superfamily
MNREGATSPRVRLVTFDAAGTILEPHPSVGAVYREVALYHGREYDETALESGFRTAFSCVSKDETELDPENRERDFWRRVVLHAVTTAGEPPESFDAYFDELYETFAHAHRWRVLPGVVQTLETLRAAGYRTAVVSNWDKRLHTVLAEAGLRPLFDAVVISSEAGWEKPAVGIFRVAERIFGVEPSECLHVGDSRKHDLAGARAAGWAALLVHHARSHERRAIPDEIDFLSEIPTRLGTNDTPPPARAGECRDDLSAWRDESPNTKMLE